MTINRIFYTVVPALLWSGTIFVLCFLPGSAFPKEDWLDKIYFDKLVHAFLYFVLFILLLRIPKALNFKNKLAAALICIAQGVLIEFVQGSSWIQNRSFDVYDILANVIGVAIGISIFQILSTQLKIK